MAKYKVLNSLTGTSEEFQTLDEAKVAQDDIMQTEVEPAVMKIAVITTLVENEDGSISEYGIDQQGNPLIPPTF